jgi:serine/threonine protein kinase
MLLQVSYVCFDIFDWIDLVLILISLILTIFLLFVGLVVPFVIVCWIGRLLSVLPGASLSLTHILTTTNHPHPHPSQIEVINREEYKSSVDVWSIGVIAFVLLVGYLPFNTSSPEAQLKHNYKVSFRSKHWDQISFAAKTFVARCLSIDPEERPTSGELLEMAFLNMSMHRKRRESKLPLASPTRLAQGGVTKYDSDEADVEMEEKENMEEKAEKEMDETKNVTS